MLTLITTCKNRLAHLRQTLPAMRRQSFSDVIVVDYGCEQGTSRWVADAHEGVRCIRVDDDPRFSLARARNIGARAAQTEFLCFVDADVILNDDLGAWLKQHGRAGAFYLSGARRMPELSGFVICRKADFEKTGGYDEVFRGWGGEDFDFYDRLRLLGLQESTIPATTLTPIPHGDDMRALGQNDKGGFSSKREAIALTETYRNIKMDLQRMLQRPVERTFREELFRLIIANNAKAVETGQAEFSLRLNVPLAPERNKFSRARRTLLYTVPALGPLRAAPGAAAPETLAPRPRPDGTAPASAVPKRSMDSRISFHRRRPHDPGTLTLFSIMRDEHYFLPHFLRHYRALGVRHFCVFADRCSPEFLARLEAEPDVSILLGKGMSFADEFKRAADGSTMKLDSYLREVVAEALFPGQWVLFVDGDEFLLLPPPFRHINDFTAALDKVGKPYSYAPMVDFFPRQMALRNFGNEVSPFDGAPYFDSGPYHVVQPQTGRLLTRRHGVRGRLFAYLLKNHREELLKAFPEGARVAPPATFKFPLLRQSAGVKWRGCHRVDVTPDLSRGCALAHFKFYPELDAKLALALGEGQYYRASAEYRFLALAIKLLGETDLLWAESVRFQSPADLVTASLMDLWPEAAILEG